MTPFTIHYRVARWSFHQQESVSLNLYVGVSAPKFSLFSVNGLDDVNRIIRLIPQLPHYRCIPPMAKQPPPTSHIFPYLSATIPHQHHRISWNHNTGLHGITLPASPLQFQIAGPLPNACEGIS